MIDEGSLEELVSETEFLALLRGRAVPLLRHVRGLQRPEDAAWSKSELSHLNELAHDLESFLDDFGARSNKAFFHFTELVASIRGFASVTHTLRHIRTRFRRYRVDFSDRELEEFQLESAATAGFLTRSLDNLFKALIEEARSLRLDVPGPSSVPDSVLDDVRHHLPHDIDVEGALDEDAAVSQLATKYLAARDAFEPMRVERAIPSNAIRSWVAARLDESKVREVEAHVHGTQARYDTIIKNTAVENETLTRLRGHISVALHLLEMVTGLIHFYERHESDIRWEAAKERMARIVDRREVLERTVNFCLRFATTAFDHGKKVAEGVLAQFSQIQELRIPLPKGTSLHARPLSLLVRIVNHYGTAVEMRLGEERCNAGSIMQMIRLAGKNPSTGEVVFVGDARTLADVRLLFDHGLGEGSGGVNGLPEGLAYLKG
ncbi:MAG: HPr family phosphocarrier protein [Planctomycetota bacterium]